MASLTIKGALVRAIVRRTGLGHPTVYQWFYEGETGCSPSRLAIRHLESLGYWPLRVEDFADEARRLMRESQVHTDAILQKVHRLRRGKRPSQWPKAQWKPRFYVEMPAFGKLPTENVPIMFEPRVLTGERIGRVRGHYCVKLKDELKKLEKIPSARGKIDPEGGWTTTSWEKCSSCDGGMQELDLNLRGFNLVDAPASELKFSVLPEGVTFNSYRAMIEARILKRKRAEARRLALAVRAVEAPPRRVLEATGTGAQVG